MLRGVWVACRSRLIHIWSGKKSVLATEEASREAPRVCHSKGLGWSVTSNQLHMASTKTRPCPMSVWNGKLINSRDSAARVPMAPYGTRNPNGQQSSASAQKSPGAELSECRVHSTICGAQPVLHAVTLYPGEYAWTLSRLAARWTEVPSFRCPTPLGMLPHRCQAARKEGAAPRGRGHMKPAKQPYCI